ncbi:ATP-binding protein [Streptomyces monomycini]|uniref:ATP-binding protein n=1 Tax=Streptomyces monomycini TaxID=371720 RepID=UPI0004AA4EE4|nr:ATP-binding protein [Streptomyces monomycini]
MNDGNSPLQNEWWLPRHPRSARRARKYLRELAEVWQLQSEATDTAVLMLSELTANACVHSRAPRGRYVRVRCLLHGERLRVEVSDAGFAMPEPRVAGCYDEDGRGLALVAALADEWGASPRPYGIGKVVWFELSHCISSPDPSPSPGPSPGSLLRE